MRGPRAILLRLLPLAICLAALAPAQTRLAPRRTANPHGPLKVACESCHTAASWKPIRPQPEFDHNTQTGWPLLGMHRGVACASCHVNKVFKDVSKQCSACHADIHRRQFGANCQQCHTVKGWRVAVQQTREHANRFPLIGAHAVAPCESCHKSAAAGIYSGLSTDCAACHVADFNKAVNPPHRGFPLQCDQCHGMDTWLGAKFDHAAITRFALVGAHARLSCRDCHALGQYTGTPAQCVNCHIKEFNATQNPNHVQAGFPRDCSVCHTSAQWKGAMYDHAAATRFPLTGAHIQVQCNSCHVAGRFAGTPQACEGCHLEAFNKTTNPAHAASNFPRDCSQCHTTTQWKGAKFDHNLSRFRLTGLHTQTDCAACHINGRFTGTPQACEGCHLAAFEKTTNPNHAASGLPKDCAICHTTTQWKGAQFDHSTRTKFPLTGAHVNAQCAQCHINGVFLGTPQACEGCHLETFNKTTAPNHASAGFAKDCAQCHTTAQWKGAQFDHATKTKFPLTGAHIQAQCNACHIGGKFVGTSAACEGCHLEAFNKTTSPNHVNAGFHKDCAQCHTTTQWKGAKFDHTAATKFPLTGAHTSVQCAQCHTNNVFKGTLATCEGCHLANYNKTTNPNHVTAGFPKDCTVCHTTAQWKGAKFDHTAATKFPLTGAHTSVQCAQCHTNNVFKGTLATCEGCHMANYNSTTNPNHAAAGFSKDCTVCHTTTQWKGAKFDHAKTKFPLTGAHTNTQCVSCHINGKYAGTTANCDGCHLADFNKTTNPNHVTAGFPKDCTVCHTTAQWKGAKFDHTAATKFPLTGAHTSVQCAQCHTNNIFKGTLATCDACHLANYNSTTNPNHVAAGFSKDCTVCHTTSQWKGAKFDHAKTKFPLTGAHTNTQCATCHINGKYAGTLATCDACHLANYNSTTNPNHVAAGFPKDCTVCHTTTQWKGATFNHSTATKFPLTGAHTSVQCAQCHTNNIFKGTLATCEGCHLANYNATTNPNHVMAGFPKDCTVCHTTTQWKGAKFDHTAATKFPLTGAHISVQCAQCHKNNVYKGTLATCDACHLANYTATTNPNHIAAGFPKDCAMCHTTTQWKGAKFDHTAATKFPLSGAHTSVQCAQCHKNNVYKGTLATCDACHLANYNATTNPNHVAVGFPKDCSVCHTTTQWKGATFNHSTATKFPLTGAHTSVQCAQCHTNNIFKGTLATCEGCHLANYNATTNPNHVAAGFPKDCAVCHTTTQWKGATFNHSTATKFPLTGAHISVQCAQCHKNNVYKGTLATCDACHLANYNATTNPNHVTAGFPKDCAVCHTTTQWKGAVFNHSATKFPLTGAHTSVQCALCHKNNVYKGTLATCDACHLANYNATTNPNHVAAGFPKDCSVCHTTTQWKGAVFNHSATKFPLTGAHTSVQCALCHKNNVYKGTLATCDACHLANYTATTNPNHVAAGFPKDCSVCHTTTQWKGAVFNHTAATKFPLTGAHVTVQCALCHKNNVYVGTPATCDGCHLANYNATTNPNHVTAGFPKNCSVCHTTTQWKGATFNHTTATKFPLTGAHSTVQCAQCHVNNVYLGTPATCVGCHLANYNATTTPNHVTAGFPKDCAVCHTTTQWKGAVFNHSATKFPLTGAHLTVACALCHKNNVYKGTLATCDACHLANYNATTNPNHVTAGFPKDCSICHTTTQWKGAVFNHSNTKFPLTGAHVTVTCANCHVGGRYAGTPTDCYTCHRNAFETVSNPNHLTAGFSTTCTTCHTTTQWKGARYTTHKFPIYTGNHAGKWTTCNDCHRTPASYAVFSCIDCHQHNKADTDKRHNGRKGYVYESQACYQCHPRGSS
jgi:hypothetical protein